MSNRHADDLYTILDMFKGLVLEMEQRAGGSRSFHELRVQVESLEPNHALAVKAAVKYEAWALEQMQTIELAPESATDQPEPTPDQPVPSARRAPGRKLSAEQVEEIRTSFDTNGAQAARYGVSKKYISLIRNHRARR